MPFSKPLATSIAGLFQGNDVTAPSALYLALHTADPADMGDQNELSGGGYQREPITFQLNSGLNGEDLSNNPAIVFPSGTANLGQATHFSIWDAQTGGNCWYIGELEAPASWEPGVSLALGAGVLKITVLTVTCAP